MLTLLGRVHAKELVHGLVFSLAGGVSVGDLALAEELIGGSCKGLVVDDTIAVVQVGIPEFTDGLGVDRLYSTQSRLI